MGKRFFRTWVLLILIGTVPKQIMLTIFIKLQGVHGLSYGLFEKLRDSFELFILNLLFSPAYIFLIIGT
jgi:hypothetical protein